MQISEDFWAFSFQLTNSDLFQQSWQWHHCDVMLVLMLLQTEIEVVY